MSKNGEAMMDHLTTLQFIVSSIRTTNSTKIENVVERPRPTEKKVEIVFSFWLNEEESIEFEELINDAKELSK